MRKHIGESLLSFRAELLESVGESWKLPPTLRACWNARGAYDPLRFVLRLRPDIHRELNSVTSGVQEIRHVSFGQVSAFSTLLHETVHWWQHVGSTIGLALSLLYPAQAHLNRRHLRTLLADLGAKKPLLKCKVSPAKAGPPATPVIGTLNMVLNNWHDMEFFRWLVTDPRRVGEFTKDQYFSSVAHSYQIAISSLLWLLGATFDPNLSIFPDPRNWEQEFTRLKERQEQGFFPGSNIHLPAMGAREIFEGQARLCQIQFLHLASGERATWSDFKSLDMLSPPYTTALTIFCELLGVSWPESPKSPLVGLFLLFCDISINPAEGIFFEADDIRNFVQRIDPGARFLKLCAIVRNETGLLDAIKLHSREEYLYASELLCKKAQWKSPLEIAERINYWAAQYPPFQDLLEEDRTFTFEPTNLPLRVFFSQLMRYQMDKLKSPEFFCWPGFWTAERQSQPSDLENAKLLFEKHSALFIDQADGDIYPRLVSGKSNDAIQATFLAFYSWVAMYDLSRQWIMEDGPFRYNFLWLTSKHPEAEIKQWATKQFEGAYGVSPDSFEIL